ncbi:alpha-ketoglutarate-dependent dioxygenase AlkB [Gordonia alkaliphila]|uniref:alpha-ketoglutarate-dependent dioxygenase AlkB n=1 Tax=Gordonia alkaliphila TaxID=1053547 RepID=UPI001FF4C346|nr:alpha-ketoglutarate-dependent dioxygenase AlkB [Gordonia alkaliphila]MCK0439618.1 alpha-ketoglutarate-dependent dioxygenase AlkB [Gordonia alkaliphila]
MSTGIQDSLFDIPATADDAPTVHPLATGITRRALAADAWVDLRPGWLTGTVGLFDRLRRSVPWRAEQVRMYDATLPVPRLTAAYPADTRLPDPLLGELRAALTDHYRSALPEGFASAGLCLYRDGRDSVAWHGDRIGRGAYRDTLVAIVSLGAPRVLALRPRGGGRSLRFTLGSGDLLVMGGSCQRTWDHAVPKAPGAGPRMSVQFRPPGVL